MKKSRIIKGADICSFKQVVRDGRTEKAACEEGCEGDDRVAHADIWGTASQAEEQQAQGSEAGMWLACWRDKQASVTGAE